MHEIDDQDPTAARRDIPEGMQVVEYFDTTMFTRNFDEPGEFEGTCENEFMLTQLVVGLDGRQEAEQSWRFATESCLTVIIGNRQYFSGPPYIALAPREALYELARAINAPARTVDGSALRPVYTRNPTLIGLPLAAPVMVPRGGRWHIKLEYEPALAYLEPKIRGIIVGVGWLRRPVN